MSKKSSKRNIWKLGIVMLTNDSNFGLGVYVVFMLWVGLSLAQMSFIISAWLVFNSVGQIPSGIFADRYGYKTALLIGSTIFFLGALIFALSQNFLWLFIGFSLSGFGSAMKGGADLALLYEHLKKEGKESTYKKVVGKLEMYRNSFCVVTGMLGGLMYMYHARMPFYAEAVVGALGILACIALIEPPRTTKHFPVLKQIKESIRYTFHTPKFSKIFLFSALIGSIAMITLQFIQPLYKSLDIPESYFGFIAAAFFIFRGFGAWYADKLGKLFTVDKYLVLHSAVFGLFLVLMQRIDSIFYIFPVLAVFSFLRGLYDPTVSTYINERVESDKRATMLSVNKQFLTVVAAITVSGLGIIAQKYGLQHVFFSISILSMIFLILYVLSLRKVQMD